MIKCCWAKTKVRHLMNFMMFSDLKMSVAVRLSECTRITFQDHISCPQGSAAIMTR